MKIKKIFSRESVSKRNIEFHTKIADTYDSSEEQKSQKVIDLYKKIINDIYKYFNQRKTKKIKILDIGCGTGFMEQFLNIAKDTVDGIDITEAMIKKAKKKFPTVNFAVKDIYSFNSKKRYDLIIGNAILHHLKDYEACVGKADSLLKDNGIIFFGAEPNHYFYKYLSGLIQIFRNLFYDKRVFRSGKDKDGLEEISEYHMYFSKGINPFKMKSNFLNKNYSKVDVIFSSRELFAALKERTNLKIFDYIPKIIMDSTGIISRCFYLVAYKK